MNNMNNITDFSHAFSPSLLTQLGVVCSGIPLFYSRQKFSNPIGEFSKMLAAQCYALQFVGRISNLVLPQSD